MKLLSLIIIIFVLSLANSTVQSTAIKVPDTLEERVKPCTICHEDIDKTGADAYYPRITGKPAGYLYNQLLNFRDGRRYYHPMAVLLENMSDEYMLDIARYFAALPLVNLEPEPHNLTSDEILVARNLVNKGDTTRNLPACSTCHGEALMGVEPFIPGLLGLPQAYLAAQFGGWRNGGIMRGQTPDCMSEIAKKLSQEEVHVLVAWLPAQPVTGEAADVSMLDPELVVDCQHLFSEAGFFQ